MLDFIYIILETGKFLVKIHFQDMSKLSQTSSPLTT